MSATLAILKSETKMNDNGNQEHPSPTVKIKVITPDLAMIFLEKNHPRNRKPRMRKIDQYAADMTNDEFHLSDQAISFDWDGYLINGQTRCHACVKSGKSFTAIVAYNLPPKSFLVLDSGLNRSTTDRFAMAGRDYVRLAGGIVRRIFSGFKQMKYRAFTDQEVDHFLKTANESVTFAYESIKANRRGDFGNANFLSVIARAHMLRKPEAKLLKFTEVLRTGLLDKGTGEEAIIMLRNMAMAAKGDRVLSMRLRHTIYPYIEAALDHFLKGEVVAKLKPAKKELFPLPGEDTWNFAKDR